MTAPRIEVVSIQTGETPGTFAMERVLLGVLNNVGRFDCRLSRGGSDRSDNRLDLDRFFARVAT